MRRESDSVGTRQHRVTKLLRMCWRYDVTTASGRRVQSLKIIGVAMISMFGLFFFAAEDVYNAKVTIQRAAVLDEILQSILKVANLTHRLQIERGLTVMCMGATDKEGRQNVLKSLKGARDKTDEALKTTKWPFDETVGAEVLSLGVQAFQDYLIKHRYGSAP